MTLFKSFKEDYQIAFEVETCTKIKVSILSPVDSTLIDSKREVLESTIFQASGDSFEDFIERVLKEAEEYAKFVMEEHKKSLLLQELLKRALFDEATE